MSIKHKHERGARELPLSTASKIAEVLSIDLAWLLIGVPSDVVSRPSDGPPPGYEPHLAEMLAWLVGEWEAHNDHGRARLKRRFETTFPEWEKTTDED